VCSNLLQGRVKIHVAGEAGLIRRLVNGQEHR
jgi:hypothetical protein